MRSTGVRRGEWEVIRRSVGREAKSESKQGSVGIRRVYMGNIAFCGERVVRGGTLWGDPWGRDWDDVEAVGRMWDSSGLDRELSVIGQAIGSGVVGSWVRCKALDEHTAFGGSDEIRDPQMPQP